MVILIEWSMFNLAIVGFAAFAIFKTWTALFKQRGKWIRSYKMKKFKKLVSKHNLIYFQELSMPIKVEYEKYKAQWLTFTIVDHGKMFEEEILKI